MFWGSRLVIRPLLVFDVAYVLQIMNEPHRGYIELQSMHAFDYNTDLHLGHVRESHTPFCVIAHAQHQRRATSHRIPVLHARGRSPYRRWALDALVPDAHAPYLAARHQHRGPEGVAR